MKNIKNSKSTKDTKTSPIPISVIVPVYNAQKTIARCLDTLVHQKYHTSNYEIILVDDCSTDTTREIIKPFLARHKHISLICLEKNSGPSTARNIWASLASYHILAFTDADCYPDIHRLQNIARAFEHDKVLACGGMIDNYNSDFFSTINHCVFLAEHYHSNNTLLRHLAGGNMILDKKLFNKVWWFNEWLRTHEDTTISNAIKNLWYTLPYYANIIIKHDTSDNIIEAWRKQYYYWSTSPIETEITSLMQKKSIIKITLSEMKNYFMKSDFFTKKKISFLGILCMLILRISFWRWVKRRERE